MSPSFSGEINGAYLTNMSIVSFVTFLVSMASKYCTVANQFSGITSAYFP